MAELLRSRRKALGLTLRDVESRARKAGSPIPFTTIAKIESGTADPGLARLHALLKLYKLPIQTAGDLLEVESMAGETPPEQDPRKLRLLAESAWQEGDSGRALACLFALRKATAGDPISNAFRQEAVLTLAVFAGKSGHHHLSRQLLDELLTERPDPKLLVGILVQQASSWKALGAPEAAFAYLDRAESRVKPGAHRERGWILHQRASIEIDLGEFAAAETNLRRAIVAFRKANRPYDQALSMAALARLHVDMGAFRRASGTARRAINIATRRRFTRIKMLASIQHARACLGSHAPDCALVVLREVLANAVTASDNVGRFYAHFYLWKAYDALGETARGDNERRNASYYLQFIDEASKEAIELGGRSSLA